MDDPLTNSPNNNPHNIRPALFVANMGCCCTFGAYLRSYELAVSALYAEVSSTELLADALAVPLLFLMRHSLELGHKLTLVKLHALNQTKYDSMKYKTHYLLDLHIAMKEEFEKVATAFDLPADVVADFNKHCKKTVLCVKEFSKLDFGSYSCRYPIDNDGKLVFSFERIDLLSLKNRFDAGMLLLRHTADVLEPYKEHMEFLESEVPDEGSDFW